MNKFPFPTDERLEKLIRESFEYMPGPDMRRLGQLEQKLARGMPARRMNTLPWWVVLLLAGGFATAAWWAGEQWIKRPEIISVTEQIKLQDVDTESSVEDAVSEKQSVGESKESSVIYQRETF